MQVDYKITVCELYMHVCRVLYNKSESLDFLSMVEKNRAQNGDLDLDPPSWSPNWTVKTNMSTVYQASHPQDGHRQTQIQELCQSNPPLPEDLLLIVYSISHQKGFVSQDLSLILLKTSRSVGRTSILSSQERELLGTATEFVGDRQVLRCSFIAVSSGMHGSAMYMLWQLLLNLLQYVMVIIARRKWSCLFSLPTLTNAEND